MGTFPCRVAVALPLVLVFASVAGAREPSDDRSDSVEYQRSDTNFYPRGDVAALHPNSTIVKPSEYRQEGDSFLLTGKKTGPKQAYFEVMSDWIESITPPNAPASLAIAPDAMQIRAVQGDVKVALPSAPATDVPASENMAIPNGAVIKTGSDGSAAVLFGGVASARLMPNSEAAVQQTVTPTTHLTEVDLTTGGAFSKVGTQVGVAGDYQVRTSQGVVESHGGDFATLPLPAGIDVWVAQGTVSLLPQTATSDGTGALKLIRLPPGGHLNTNAKSDTESLTAALNFVTMANRTVKMLRDKAAAGTPLTEMETAYLGRIRQVPAVMKMARVEKAPAPKATADTDSLPARAAVPISNQPPMPNLPTSGLLLHSGSLTAPTNTAPAGP